MNKFRRSALMIVCAFSVAIATQAQSNYEPYPFTTLAGNAGYGSNDGTGSAASFQNPSGVAVDSSNNVYVADYVNHTIRKITSAGVVTTLAGMAGSFGSADGTGSAARFNSPFGVAVDGSGNVYVADSANNTIRKITAAGVVSTLAGSPGAGGSADGTGSTARFNNPQGIAVDGSGNVYVADTNNYTIRKITPAAVVTTLAGLAGNFGSGDGTGSGARFNSPSGVTATSAGLLYVADTYNQTIRRVTSGGIVTTFAGSAGFIGSTDATGSSARFSYPIGVSVDGSGNVYVADSTNNTIRKITSLAVVTTLAGSPSNSGSADGTGNSARFNNPNGVAVSSAGDVYVGDTSNNTIRKVTAGGVVTTFAGLAGRFGSADGTGAAARFDSPGGVAVDSAGNVYVADTNNNTIRKITPGAVVSTLAGTAGLSGSANGMGAAARFSGPAGLAVDSSNNIYVADTFNHTIRKITPVGLVSTLAGSGSSGSNDGTGVAARFSYPGSVAVDSAGNVYVADTGNHTIRKITSAGMVTTLAGLAGASGTTDATGTAARFKNPQGIAVDSSGNLYVADTNNQTIRKITPAALVTTIAGVAGTPGNTDGSGVTRFNVPYSVAVDGAGSVYVLDNGGQTVRKINSAGLVRTLAGLSSTQGAADGAGSAVRFTYPQSIAVTSAGLVYVADTQNCTIRKGGPAPAPTTQSFNGSGLPLTFQNSAFAAGAATTFSNLPNSTSIAVSVDITVTNTTLSNLQVLVFPGTFGPTGLPPTNGPIFTLWDHEQLLNAAGQPVTHLQATAILPFAGGDRYTVSVVDDTYGSPNTQVGVFNSCTLTIQPNNPGHTAPPTVNLYGGTLNQPVPGQLDYAQPLTLVATAAANPTSYTISRLGITVTGPASYTSPEVFEASQGAGVSLTLTPTILPPGLYQIAAKAIDSAGFAQTTTANLTVNRLFGLFSIANLNSTVNGNQTTSFTANLVVTNNTATGSGNLRVHLIQVASASFRDVEGPPDLSPYPPTELSLIAVPALGAGATTQVPISGLVAAPLDAGTHPELQDRKINFHVYAVLDEFNNGQWVSIDSLKVIDGVQKHDVDFGGPGGGVNDPPPEFGGTPFDPKILQSVTVTGPLNVADSGTIQYVAMATATNKAGPTTLPVTSYSQWGTSLFSISNVGSFLPGFVSTATPAQLSASFKLSTNSPTKTGTFSVIVYPFRLTSLTNQSNGATLVGKGIPGQTVFVQASPDLVTQFGDIGSTTADGAGIVTFPAPHAFGLGKQFYRLRYP